jgi:hypothetical protein
MVPVILGALLWPREREPDYAGVPLSTWVIRCNNNIRFDSEACEAIGHMGTNGLPFLIRWIQYETPSWKLSLFDACAKLPPPVLNSRFMRWLLTDKAWLRANGAMVALTILKSDADPALPELQRIANQAKAQGSSPRAQCALFCIELIKARVDPMHLPVY